MAQQIQGYYYCSNVIWLELRKIYNSLAGRTAVEKTADIGSKPIYRAKINSLKFVLFDKIVPFIDIRLHEHLFNIFASISTQTTNMRV